MIQTIPLYSELNPLIVPKLLTKPVFTKELFVSEKSNSKDDEEYAEKSVLEEELRQTLNDLDLALNSTDVIKY